MRMSIQALESDCVSTLSFGVIIYYQFLLVNYSGDLCALLVLVIE